MFSKYWRTYPWWLQLILYVLMIFTLASFFTLLAIVAVSNYSGVDTSLLTKITDKSPQRLINSALIVQVLSALGIFVLPALLFAYLMTPRPAKYLGLRMPGKNIHWLLVTLIMAGVMPLLLEIGGLMKNIDLGPAAKAMEEQDTNMMNAFLKMDSPLQFFIVFFSLAILPAIGEELTFRGILMRFAAKRSRTMFFPITVSALFFAGMHGNISGLPSIFLAGVLLGTIYYLTGSIWCSMLAHFLNNGIQVALLYAGTNNTQIKTFVDSNALPVPFLIGGALVFAVSLWLLVKNKTPLADNWTDDFTAQELIDNAG